MFEQMEITVAETAKLLSTDSPPLLIDCREENEHEFCRIEGAILVPLSDFAGKAEALLKHSEEAAIIYCHHGVRSLHAAHYLHQQGYTNTLSMHGGIEAWSLKINAGIPRY